MQKAWRMVKAVIYGVLLMLAVGAFLTLLAFTKGLLVLLLIFGVVVWGIYQNLERKDYDRNWRERNRAWRNYK